jgi:NAD(P)-dependent dehydrogenase (short-subunit alcohol dehydrogenase family)
MELKLAGKVAVITGGAGGIGSALAKAFAGEGCKVGICDKSDEGMVDRKNEFAARGEDLFTGSVDVGDGEEMSNFISNVHEHYRRIDIWVNNAGVNRIKPYRDLTLADWEFIVRTNLTSVFWATHTVAEYMKKDGGGVILNTASFAGLMPYSKGVPYSATKAGILNMTRSTAGILAPFGIRVNAVVPGSVETAILKNRLEDPVYKKSIISRVSLQRVCTADEIAKTYLFLASEETAGYITGTAIEVTGGKYCIQDVMNPWEEEGA